MTVKDSKKTSRMDWHPADIVAALHKRGFTLRDVAKQHGLSDSTSLSRAMINSAPINERRIAEAAGIPVQIMYAARYYPDGTPVPRGIRGERKLRLKSTQFNAQCNGNLTQAA